jgi:hypothetical protein
MEGPRRLYLPHEVRIRTLPVPTESSKHMEHSVPKSSYTLCSPSSKWQPFGHQKLQVVNLSGPSNSMTCTSSGEPGTKQALATDNLRAKCYYF